MPTKKKPFNKFSLAEAYHFLQLRKLEAWQLDFAPVETSAFFQENLKRLHLFDLISSESGKEVLIDAILQAALNRRTKLKVWKEVTLKTSEVNGRVEYILAEHIDILETPYVCLIEANKDDFEKGLAQCLVGLKVCQILNRETGQAIEVYGVVTNAYTWRFYQLSSQNRVFESMFYSI